LAPLLVFVFFRGPPDATSGIDTPFPTRETSSQVI